MPQVLLLLRIISLMCLLNTFSTPHLAAKAVSMSKPGCPESCANNNVTIPYPFGIGRKDCYHNRSFEITCNDASKPVLKSLNMEVLNISIQSRYGPYGNTMILNRPVFSTCKHGNFWQSSDLRGSPFEFSSHNTFFVLGCNNILLQNQSGAIMAGCTSTCDADPRSVGTDCYGINCCQTTIPSLSSYSLNASTSSKTNNATNNNCVNDTKGFLMAWFYRNDLNVSAMYQLDEAPVTLSWILSDVFSAKDASPYGYVKKKGSYCSASELGSGTLEWSCYCEFPYEGNPYFLGGCRVIEECAGCKHSCDTAYDSGRNERHFCRKSHKTTIILGSGLGGGVFCLLFAAFVFWLVKEIRRRREIKQRKKFFKRNGGFLLQQELSSSNDSVERTKIFTIAELEKATDGFNANRILGQGGQGTVYKGMLTDGKTVAVKRSKKMDDNQVEQFINEVVILSQINHRNIVQLLGCCLETEVPLLVYEFISNGSLFQLIHSQDEDFPPSWETRLRIATEVAGALAYLHSSSSCPLGPLQSSKPT